MDESLSGYVDAIVFAQAENGFTVARLKEPKKRDLTVIVGYMPALQAGENVVCKGTWKNHPSHGRQFEVSEFTVESPSDVLGIQKYLESGLVKGIGPVYAKKIVDKFGSDTLDVIDKTPHRLLEVEGLGKKKVNQLKECWEEQRSIREVMVFLRAHGASPGYAQKIYKQYGDESIAKVKENPYQLAKEVFGIGFKMADAIALKLGFALHSPERLAAGIEFVLWEMTNEGHTCFPIVDFVPIAMGMLGVESALIEAAIKDLINKQLIEQEGMIWLKPYFAFEQGIARDLMRLKTGQQAIREIDATKAIGWVQSQLTIRFAEQQQLAVMQALIDKVHIITGGPGTGKSTITNAILAISSKLTDKIILGAPTGRAAKRLTQITRKLAFTIHALLEMDFKSGGFKKGKDNPLDCDLLIIDEASMIDTSLLFYLLRAIPSRTRVLFVGDIDQLPSVGAGTVLRDLISSGLIGVTCLTEIFRQAKGSKIITNAHRINHGEFPDIDTPERSDFHFIQAETPEAIQEVILQLVSSEIPRIWGYHPIDDIQVLSPMKKGLIGAEMLNDALQNLLNPSTNPVFRAGRRFHVSDKVMQIKNNYDKNVYNGDIGRIVEISAEHVLVRFDEKEVEYDLTDLDELVLAYATSVHKYQGSECPCVVIPIHTSHFKLLHRNLLYTAVTRGKRQVYLVGTTKAIAIAVNNNQVQKRYTGLEKAIKEMAKTYQPDTHHQLKFV
ncbi:MAG TPA: ATP-dependent RecD-like DNA helicase [Chlamydiales bacterium]|nr:ATP-dependent RecD-like DNA helicase [Chlamydiales bacterium]